MAINNYNLRLLPKLWMIESLKPQTLAIDFKLDHSMFPGLFVT